MIESVVIDDPLERLEVLAHRHSWDSVRKSATQLHLCLRGEWTEYDFDFQWNADLSCLHLTALFDSHQNGASPTELRALLAHINARLWLGFFSVAGDDAGGGDDATIVFRHSHLLTEEESLNSCETLVEVARAALDKWSWCFYLLARGASLASTLQEQEKVSQEKVSQEKVSMA